MTIFCLDNFQSKLLPVLCKSTEVIESCVIEVCTERITLILVAVYRPQSCVTEAVLSASH